MDINDLFTPQELEELSDDPRVAFAEIVRKATAVLRERTQGLFGGREDAESWRYALEERYGFVNLIVAAGKTLKIEPFVSRQVADVTSFEDSDYREFRSELDHYMTQMALDNARRGKREGITLPPDAKARIRKHISALKLLIDASEIGEKKKMSMRSKLDQFEKELDKQRLPLGAVGVIALSLFALPPDLADNAQMAIQAISGIFGEVQSAKSAEDEQRQLPLIEEPLLLSPPRIPEAPFTGPRPTRTSAAPAFEGGADEEIPF
jgi:hypothetical protein